MAAQKVEQDSIVGHHISVVECVLYAIDGDYVRASIVGSCIQRLHAFNCKIN